MYFFTPLFMIKSKHLQRSNFSYKVVVNLIAEAEAYKHHLPRQYLGKSFCRSNLIILCIYFSKLLGSLWHLPQECLTEVARKGIMKLIKL